METVKRVYAKPTILKVQLSHEQAVLGLCSTTTTSVSRGSARLICNKNLCRKDSSNNGNDNMANS